MSEEAQRLERALHDFRLESERDRAALRQRAQSSEERAERHAERLTRIEATLTRIEEKLDAKADVADVADAVAALKGARVFGALLKWIAAVAVAIGVLTATLKGGAK